MIYYLDVLNTYKYNVIDKIDNGKNDKERLSSSAMKHLKKKNEKHCLLRAMQLINSMKNTMKRKLVPMNKTSNFHLLFIVNQ